MRYTDWAISTPLMLLVLCMVLGMENKITVTFMPFVLILLFNFLMLGSGYVGELGKLSTTNANIIGFVFFSLMYGTIWKVYMTGSKVTKQSKVIFWLFVILWAMYGVFYQTPQLTKIFGYNILDLLSICWHILLVYLTKLLNFDIIINNKKYLLYYYILMIYNKNIKNNLHHLVIYKFNKIKYFFSYFFFSLYICF